MIVIYVKTNKKFKYKSSEIKFCYKFMDFIKEYAFIKDQIQCGFISNGFVLTVNTILEKYSTESLIKLTSAYFKSKKIEHTLEVKNDN